MSVQLSLKKRSVFVGIFILVAYGVLVSAITQVPAIVMVADVISGLAVIGIALLMFPLFKETDRWMTYSYLVLKFGEGLLMVAGGFLYLNPSFHPLREAIYNGIHLYIFIVSGMIFYVLLYRSKLVPRFISLWGMAGIGALLASTIFSLAGIPLAFLDYFLVLIITNEIFLAGWLFVPGLRLDSRIELGD